MSLPRPKKPKDVDVEWMRAATLRPNRRNTATIRRLSVISMSSRVAVAQFQGTTPSTGRQAKKVNVPVVPNMTVVEKNRYIDEGVKRDLGCRSRASPSQMSNYHGSDSQNSSRNSRPTIFETNSPSSFSCYGTDAAHLLGTKVTVSCFLHP